MITNRPDWINYAYEKEPNIEMLKKALENEQWLITDRETKLKAIRLKYQAMTTVPTIIEKTMSPEQLYDAKNIAWAKGLTVREIDQWRQEYDKKHPYVDMDTLREQEGWLDVYYEDDE